VTGVYEKHLTLVDRSLIERVARIAGPSSASAKALADADACDGPVRFFLSDGVVIVEKVKRV